MGKTYYRYDKDKGWVELVSNVKSEEIEQVKDSIKDLESKITSNDGKIIFAPNEAIDK